MGYSFEKHQNSFLNGFAFEANIRPVGNYKLKITRP